MLDLEQIRQQARTTTLYDDQHPEGQRGVIHLLHGQLITCCYHPQADCYVWYIGVDRARESAVQALLNQHRQ